MSPPDSISPISPYAPGKPVIPHRKAPQERDQQKGHSEESPEKNKKPASQPEKEKQEKSGPGVDRYA